MEAKVLLLLLSVLQLAHVSHQLPAPTSKNTTSTGLKNKEPQLNNAKKSLFETNDIRRPLKRNGNLDINNRWPGGVIPYTIDSAYTTAQRNVILEAMNDFAKYTCIKFVPYTNEPNHVRIFKSGSGCWSYVGRTHVVQDLSLDDWGVNDKYVALHELNHAVGFEHEQNRHDRDNFLTIRWENVDPAQASSLDKHNWVYGFGIDYDCYSAMHYGPVSYAINGQATLICTATPEKPVGSGQSGLSAKDLAKIHRMYKCYGSVALF